MEQKTLTKTLKLSVIADKYTHGNISALSRLLKLSPTAVNAWLKRDTFDADLLLRTFPDLSAEWLMRGKGPMLLSERTAPDNSAELTEALALIKSQASTIDSLHKLLNSYIDKTK